MIVDEHFLKQVQTFESYQVLVFFINEFLQTDFFASGNLRKITAFHFNVVLADVSVQVLSSKHFNYFEKLVLVVLSNKKIVKLENESSQNTAQRPNVHCKIVTLKIQQQLGPFEGSRAYSCVKWFIGKIEIREPPVY
jgi:hypothetical protein